MSYKRSLQSETNSREASLVDDITALPLLELSMMLCQVKS